MKDKPAVFHDPRGRKRRVTGGVALAVGAITSVLAVLFVISLISRPLLLKPPDPERVPPSLSRKPSLLQTRQEREFLSALTRLKRAQKEQERLWKRRTPHVKENNVVGFYVSWDDASFSSLQRRIASLDWLVAELLHVRAGDDPLLEIPDSNFSPEWALKTNPSLKLFALVNDFDPTQGVWNDALLQAILKSPAQRAALADRLLRYLKARHFAGVVFDFEDLSTQSRSLLAPFLAEFKADVRSREVSVAVAVPLADPEFDYLAFSKVADFLMLMAYDEHWPSGRPGPIASQNWLEENLLKRARQIDPHKLVLIVGAYGYDWSNGTSAADEISFQEALQTAKESAATIQFDPASFNPHFEYDETDGSHHSVWFLDAVTLFNHLSAAEVYPLAGYGFWRLGTGDPSMWSVIEDFTGTEAQANKILTIPPSADLDFEGQGELLEVFQTSGEGSRQIQFDAKLGLIKEEQFPKTPGSFRVRRRGFVPKKIVLTFDDGPDPRYTPEILQILKEKGVPACFFVIGRSAELYPQLLRQAYNEGHEVGVHTFTHPNLGAAGAGMAALEINATQRLIQSVLQRATILFRPPYGVDSTPHTFNEIRSVMVANRLGYITVAQEIVSDDWREPGVRQIVERTLQQVALHQHPSLTVNVGNIVLLHDGGGDRSQTVQALPEIIDALKRQGYQLVSLSQLLNMTRDQLMPAFPSREQYLVRADHYLFLTLGLLARFGRWIFLVVIVLALARILLVSVMAIRHWRAVKMRRYSSEYSPSVSVLIPCFNEESVIADTLSSVLASDYANFEVIVIDDGSADKTAEVVENRFSGVAKVTLLRQANAGKSAALNRGIARSSGEILIIVDGDTQFLPSTIAKLVRHFQFPETGAVAGNAKVGNRINLLTACQALEYVTTQNLDRRAFDLLNGITVVPGAVGAWRRTVVLQLGGFDSDTLAEDQDLTMKILRTGRRVVFEPEAVAFTEAPDRVRGLIRQRFRWCYGTLQCVWKHQGAVLEKKSGLGRFSIPNVLVFQILFPLMSPIMDLLLVWSVGAALYDKFQHDLPFWSGDMLLVGFFYAVFVLVDWLYSLLAFLLEAEDKKLLLLVFVQRLIYRQLMYVVLFRSLLRALTGIAVGWGKLERKATVTR